MSQYQYNRTLRRKSLDNAVIHNFIPISVEDNIIEKINKKCKTFSKEEQIIYLKGKIENIQTKFGNKSEILFKLYQKYIHLIKTNADLYFNENKFEEALKIYKECLKLTEPLPNSEWTNYSSWCTTRVSIMNDIAITYEKLNKVEKAIEYIRLGINLEETYGNEGYYDAKYNNIFYSAGKQLMILEQYEEAIKYLTKVESKMYSNYKINKIIARKRIDKRIDREFLLNNPNEYIELLNLICKAYIKIGNYTKSDIYYERQNELIQLLEKSKTLRTNRNFLNNFSAKKKTLKTENSLVKGIINSKENNENKKIDKAEENNYIYEELNFKNRRDNRKKSTIRSDNNIIEFSNDSYSNININKTPQNLQNKRKSRILKIINYSDSKNNKDLRTLNKSSSIENRDLKNIELKIPNKSEKRKSISNKKFIKNQQVELPLIKQERKNLKETVKKNINYPPTNFKFKKQKIYHKLPLLNMNSIKKNSFSLSKETLNHINQLAKPKKIAENFHIFKRRPFSENKNKELKKIKEKKIFQKLKDIQKTLETQNSIKSNLSKKNLSRQNSIKNIKNFEEIENIPTKKSISKKNLPIRKIPSNKNISKFYTLKKFEFPSQTNKNYLNLSNNNNNNNNVEKTDEKNKNESKTNTLISFGDYNKNVSSNRNKTEEDFNSQNSEYENDKTNNNEITINKIKKFKPEKIEIKNSRRISKNKNKINLKNIPLLNLVYNYFNKMHLINNLKFNKKNLIHQTFEFNDLCLFKSFNNKILLINFSLPFYNINNSNIKNLTPFIEIDVIFNLMNYQFNLKYKIKLNQNEDFPNTNEKLIDNLIKDLNNKEKQKIDLSWQIALFFFEYYFSLFKQQYDYNIYEEVNDVNKEFFKKYIEQLNNYVLKLNMWEKKNDKNIKYINIIMKYFLVFLKYLNFNKNIIGYDISLKSLNMEFINQKNLSRKNKIKTITKFANKLNDIGHKNLLKKLLYDSFIIKGISNFKQELMQSNIDNETNNLNQYDIKNDLKNFEDYFFDNEILYKGITKLNNHYMYFALSVRSFINAINQLKKIRLTDVPNHLVISRSKIINFDNLKFLSVNEEISKKYTNLKIDLNNKFYGKTNYKTFLQFSFIDLQSLSNWIDFSYTNWESFIRFLSFFEKNINYKNFIKTNFELFYIYHYHKLNKIIGVFLSFYINKFCNIENGTFNFNVNYRKEEINNKIFFDFYNIFDYYNYNNIYNKNKDFFISYYSKNFFDYYLINIHKYYYNFYFKENNFYDKDLLENFYNSISEENLKNIENKSSNKLSISKKIFEPLNFNLYLTLGKNRYNAIIKIYQKQLKISNDSTDLKNYLIPSKKITNLFIQLRSILSDELIHCVITNEKQINSIISIYENNELSVLKIYFQNLINIVDFNYGKSIILDLNYKRFKIKTEKINENDLNLLKKVSIMLKYKSNEKLKLFIEGLKFIKCYKKCMLIKNNNRLIFNYKVYQDNLLTIKDVKTDITVENETDEEIDLNKTKNLYSKLFGKIELSNENKMNKYYNKKKINFQYEKYKYYIYIIDIYYPKTSNLVNFLLSSRDLSFILKKIKNKNIQKKYLVSTEELINLIPKKITIRKEDGGNKVLLNFTKYKQLRMDWKEQLEYKKIKENKKYNKKLPNYIKENKKKIDLKIYLKTNFVNISEKEGLYDISTNEMVIILKCSKIYEIKEKKYICLVSIYYHRILEYWNLFLFFPHNARKFFSILEPKEVTRIITSENFMNMKTINEDKISEKEIWKYIIFQSKITINIEGNAYFEVFYSKLLLKELLYNGFEIISDGFNDELNKIIYAIITIRTENLFLLDSIEKIIEKVEIDNTHLIFQTFSFQDLSWHKENFKLEDFEPFFKDKIITDFNVVKIKEISKNEEIISEKYLQNHHNNSRLSISQLVPKIIEKSKTEVIKYLPFSFLRKMNILIIQPYVNSQQHMFEKQKKDMKNKGLEEGNLTKLIDNIRFERAHRKVISNIYMQKLENQIIFQKIYSEYINYNPPILASIGLNIVKEKIIITLFYPYQSKVFNITIDFDKVKKLFFPYFNDILVIDKLELGKRIMKRYENFIKKFPHFLKLFDNSKNIK